MFCRGSWCKIGKWMIIFPVKDSFALSVLSIFKYFIHKVIVGIFSFKLFTTILLLLHLKSYLLWLQELILHFVFFKSLLWSVIHIFVGIVFHFLWRVEWYRLLFYLILVEKKVQKVRRLLLFISHWVFQLYFLFLDDVFVFDFFILPLLSLATVLLSFLGFPWSSLHLLHLSTLSSLRTSIILLHLHVLIPLVFLNDLTKLSILQDQLSDLIL